MLNQLEWLIEITFPWEDLFLLAIEWFKEWDHDLQMREPILIIKNIWFINEHIVSIFSNWDVLFGRYGVLLLRIKSIWTNSNRLNWDSLSWWFGGIECESHSRYQGKSPVEGRILTNTIFEGWVDILSCELLDDDDICERKCFVHHRICYFSRSKDTVGAYCTWI